MSQDAPLKVKYIDLVLANLYHPDSIMLMGGLCASALTERGQITLFVDNNNRVQQALPYDLELDKHPEKLAIQYMLDDKKTDDDIVEYLKGREARLKTKEVPDAEDM